MILDCFSILLRSRYYKCDGNTDCEDGSDEVGCANTNAKTELPHEIEGVTFDEHSSLLQWKEPSTGKTSKPYYYVFYGRTKEEYNSGNSL